MSLSPPQSGIQRIFFVTGATDGIGRHTAQKLAADGHGLVVHGRRPAAGSDLIADLRRRGAAFVHYLNADLGDLEQVEHLATETERLGLIKIDVLINNAGVFDPEPRTSAQGYDMTWAVNVMAPFVLTRRLLPLISKGDKPRIITTSSISQSLSLPNLSELFARGDEIKSYSAHRSYSNSKLGDLMFTAKLAKVLASQSDPRLSSIQCLTMDPGTVNTKMLLAGWGACGIPVKKANNTYKLAATPYGEEAPSGSYHFGGRASPDSKDDAKLSSLWKALELHTGCTYDDCDTAVQ